MFIGRMFLQTWNSVSTYAVICLSSVCAAGFAQACCACAGARARRILHERLLHATLHAPLHHYNTTPAGDMLHRFSSDIQIIDKVRISFLNLQFYCIKLLLNDIAYAQFERLIKIK